MERKIQEGGEHAEVTRVIIGAAIEVHRALGPGLLESAYESCLAHEFTLQGLSFKRQLELPVQYKGNTVDAGFRLDFIVEGCVIIEVKAVNKVNPIHQAQVLTYLKLTNLRVGLLINFNTKLLTDGVTRLII